MEINHEAEYATAVDRLLELFIYRPETGLLLHRRARGMGISRVLALQPAGTVGRGGYLSVTIDGRIFRGHRVCWAIHFGAWPPTFLDHINKVKLDNRIANLREATKSENSQNAKVRSDSTSGVAGVGWQEDRKQWRARITVDGVVHNLGRYDRLEDAAMVRRVAEHAYWRGLHTFPQAA